MEESKPQGVEEREWCLSERSERGRGPRRFCDDKRDRRHRRPYYISRRLQAPAAILRERIRFVVNRLPDITTNKKRWSSSTWFFIIGWTIWFFVAFLSGLDLFEFGYFSSIILMLTVFGLIFRVKARKANPTSKRSSLLSIWFPGIGWTIWVVMGVLADPPNLWGIDFYRSSNVFVVSSLVIFVLMVLGLIFGAKSVKSGAGLPGIILSVLGLIYLILNIFTWLVLGSLGSGFH